MDQDKLHELLHVRFNDIGVTQSLPADMGLDNWYRFCEQRWILRVVRFPDHILVDLFDPKNGSKATSRG